MNFFRSNLRLIAKTFVFQIVISLLGMMLGTATGAYTALRLVGAVCADLVYLYVLGLHFWRKGAEDAIKGEAKKFPLTGLWVSLIAFLPSIVCVLISFILPMAGADGAQNWVFAVFVVTKLVFMGVYFGFAAVMYPTGADMTSSQIIEASKGQSGFFVVALIPAIIVCTVAYVLGYKNKDPLNIFRNESRNLR